MRRGFGKIHTKKAFWAKYNGECVEVSAKYIQKKAFWAKYNIREPARKDYAAEKFYCPKYAGISVTLHMPL